MERTAQEFVHQLPSGRWFVGDFVATKNGQEVFLVETIRGLSVAELTLEKLADGGVPTYAQVGRQASRATRSGCWKILAVALGLSKQTAGT